MGFESGQSEEDVALAAETEAETPGVGLGRGVGGVPTPGGGPTTMTLQLGHVSFSTLRAWNTSSEE